MIDHAKYAKEYIKCGFQVYASQGTADALGEAGKSFTIMRSNYWYQIGGFNITPFECHHDVECYGFIIRHEDFGTLLFATDTAYIKNNFKGLNLSHILIESNYSEAIVNGYLEQGIIDKARIERVFKTHMEIGTTAEFIKANKTNSLDSVLLLHLSEGNANPEGFQQTIQEVVGDGVVVRIADKNVTYSLDICPF